MFQRISSLPYERARRISQKASSRAKTSRSRCCSTATSERLLLNARVCTFLDQAELMYTELLSAGSPSPALCDAATFKHPTVCLSFFGHSGQLYDFEKKRLPDDDDARTQCSCFWSKPRFIGQQQPTAGRARPNSRSSLQLPEYGWNAKSQRLPSAKSA